MRGAQLKRCSGTHHARIVALIEKLIHLLQIANDSSTRLPQAARVLVPPVVVSLHRHAVAGQIEALPLSSKRKPNSFGPPGRSGADTAMTACGQVVATCRHRPSISPQRNSGAFR